MNPAHGLGRFLGSLVIASMTSMPRAASALDVVTATPPVAITDGTLKIGARSLRLPPGDWVLVGREAFMVGAAFHNFGVDAYAAWALWLDGQRLRALVRLSLPAADAPQMARYLGSLCGLGKYLSSRELSHGTGHDCVSLFGRQELTQHLASRAPDVARFLESRHIGPLGAAAQVAYMLIMDSSYGRIDVYLPAASFDGDADAASWAMALRTAIAPLFEERVEIIELPAFPALPDSAASPQ